MTFSWTDHAVALANSGPASQATPMTAEHLESLAECALGPTRKTAEGVEDRAFHLEHIASYDVPLLIREIVRLAGRVITNTKETP